MADISPIDPSKNIILMASAGTGKTFNLALRAVACLMRTASPSSPLYDIEGREAGGLPLSSKGRILAITFTRKATEEMRRRVNRYLGELADGVLSSDSPEFMELKEALHITDPSELRERAAACRRALFYNPRNLRISTIDGFMKGILKLFPLETDIPKDFEITKEPPSESALNSVFTLLAERGRYLALFRHHIERERTNKWDYSSFDFFEKLAKSILWVMSNGNYIYLEKALEATAQKDISHISLIFDELLRADGEVLFTTGELLKILKKGAGHLHKTLEKHIPSFTLLVEGRERIDALTDRFAHFSTFLPHRLFHEDERVRYRKLLADLERALFRRAELSLDYDRELVLHLSSKVYLEMDRIKRERREFTYEDITRGVYNLFVRGGRGECLYFRLDGTLEHILADEFQDTSAVQWEILRPLCEEAMAGLSQGGKSGSFFCVGDSKQSIYRFRGAMPAFMSRLEADYKGRLISRELDVNYRSDKNIVEFANTIFADADKLINGGEELRFNFPRQRANSQKDGFVKLVKITGKGEEKRVKRLEALKVSVEELCGAGYALNDIACLVTKRERGFEAARYLNEQGFTASATFTKKLTESAVFRAVIAFAEYLRGGGSLSLTEFLCIPPACIDMRRLSDKRYMDRMKYLLDRAVSGLRERSVYRKAAELSGRFSFAARFSKSTAFTALFDMLAKGLPFETNPLIFTEKLLRLASSSESSDRAHGITVSTVHGAKGLEFPAVILFNVSESYTTLKEERILSRKDTPVMYKRLKKASEAYAPHAYLQALEEEKAFLRYERLNALYVAITRARHALYVFAEERGGTTDSYVLERVSEGSAGELSHFENPSREEAEETSQEGLSSADRTLTRFLRRNLLPKIKGEEARGTLSNPSLPYSLELRLERYLENAAEREEERAGYEPAASRLYGLLFHEMVYMLDLKGAAEGIAGLGERAIAKVWPSYAPYLREEDLTRLKGDAAALLKDESFRELLKGRKIFRERKFFHKGELLVIDLYALGEGDINLLDFKTSDADTDRLQEYREQTEKYSGALREAYRLPVNSSLLFVKEGAVKWK